MQQGGNLPPSGSFLVEILDFETHAINSYTEFHILLYLPVKGAG